MSTRSSHHTKKAKTKKQRVSASFLMLNPNPIIEVGFEGTIFFFNPATETAFPDLKEQGLRHPIFRDWKIIVETFKNNDKTSFNREIQIGEKWFIEQIFLVPETPKIRIYFIGIDELKKTQQELEKEKNILQAVMDGAKNIHLVYLDNDFNFIRVNEAYANTCGYKPKDMIGKNHFVLYPHNENEAIFKKVRDTGIPIEFRDKPFVFPDQAQRGITYWDWTLQPVMGNDGKVIGLVFSLVETTERKRIQAKLEENAHLLEEYASKMEALAGERAKQLSLAERLAAIGQTAGMVGHDIRNPLQAIAGELYLAREELESMPDSDSKKSIQGSIVSIEQNLYYIDKIVADLQDYTKPLKASKVKINVEKAIEEALLIVNIPNNLHVNIAVEEGFPQLLADLSMLKRVLTNLIQNAVQAMPNGGTLKISALKRNERAQISVEDNGEGIPEEIKEKMFTPLFTTKSKGQGFGLAVVKRLVEAQDGKISFESRKGKGTTFTIQLPLA